MADSFDAFKSMVERELQREPGLSSISSGTPPPAPTKVKEVSTKQNDWKNLTNSVKSAITKCKKKLKIRKVQW